MKQLKVDKKLHKIIQVKL